jgi:uncharacterized protein YciI
MPYALICRDRPGAQETRRANRDAHLAYVADTGVVSFAGPLLDDDEQMTGSLIVLDVPDRPAAEAWAQCDPYGKAGLFETVEIHGFRKVVG